MCGIAGTAGEHRERIERMTKALLHRGPDGHANEIVAGASLGHCRLAILDPRPEGNQPMWNDDKTVAIVFNGEIFNYRRLKESENMKCRTGTDTEVILKLYEKYGMKFVARLRGMFAFGIYDTRDHSWNLARDANGINPLFVAYPNGELCFASETRALMQAFDTKPALDMLSVSAYLRLQYVPGPRTMCEGIESLPPGTVLIWKDGKETRTQVLPDEAEVHFTSKQDFKERFPAIMDEAVRDHLISDVPVGISLSGGMDSSIVLHHMCKNSTKQVSTFTVRFEATKEEGAERFNKDADLAAMTAKHYGTDHHEILLTAALCRDIYADSARALDQPNADSVAMAQFALAREAKKSVSVLLSGAGGDELFGGYPRYRVARVLKMLQPVPAAIRKLGASVAGLPPDVLAMQPGPALAERLLARPLKELQPILKGDWFDRVGVSTLFKDRYGTDKNAVRAFMEFDRHLWLVDESLRLCDGVSLASGVECRIPFLDRRVIMASHGTDTNWHVTPRRTKALLKDTYRSILPEHLFTLKKASFYPPLAKWIRREMAPMVEAMLEHKKMNELFDMATVRSIYEDHKTGKRYGLHTLSSLLQLQHWFDEVYDAVS